MKFESHITFLREHSEAVNEIAQITGWTYSQIDGDPIMGKQAYCYLTAYDVDIRKLYARMSEVVQLCKESGVEPLRTKIELIVFDSKTGVDVLGLETIEAPQHVLVHSLRRFADIWEAMSGSRHHGKAAAYAHAAELAQIALAVE